MIACLEEGVFDALEKRFLKSFLFGIALKGSDEEKPQLIEVSFSVIFDNVRSQAYQFQILYPSSVEPGVATIQLNAVRANMSTAHIPLSMSKEEIRQSTMILLRTLITLVQTLRPCPRDRVLVMEVCGERKLRLDLIFSLNISKAPQFRTNRNFFGELTVWPATLLSSKEAFSRFTGSADCCREHRNEIGKYSNAIPHP